MNKFLILALLLLAGSTTSCLESECGLNPTFSVVTEQHNADISAIDEFLNENELEAQIHPSGVRYIINEGGSGDRPTLCDRVIVDYTGSLMLEGTVFEDPEEPASFALSTLIPGWQIGIPLINAGGNVTLFIPSTLAYGTQARDNIPANSILRFDIELLAVN
ncbi:MAG: FKBP-type peptidyl-prolyl cis-trans isomerase [Bacteroidota bacterium]